MEIGAHTLFHNGGTSRLGRFNLYIEQTLLSFFTSRPPGPGRRAPPHFWPPPRTPLYRPPPSATEHPLRRPPLHAAGQFPLLPSPLLCFFLVRSDLLLLRRLRSVGADALRSYYSSELTTESHVLPSADFRHGTALGNIAMMN
jgi:hypothetical protein